MYRQKYDLRQGARFSQLIGCIYPVEFRHRNVSDDHIRLQFPGSFDQGFTVPHTPDHIEGWLQETLNQLQKGAVVIGQEYSNFLQLGNPQGPGRRVIAFVSMASYPGWRRRTKLEMDLAKGVPSKLAL